MKVNGYEVFQRDPTLTEKQLAKIRSSRLRHPV
jgi:hypothetical protein